MPQKRRRLNTKQKECKARANKLSQELHNIFSAENAVMKKMPGSQKESGRSRNKCLLRNFSVFNTYARIFETSCANPIEEVRFAKLIGKSVKRAHELADDPKYAGFKEVRDLLKLFDTYHYHAMMTADSDSMYRMIAQPIEKLMSQFSDLFDAEFAKAEQQMDSVKPGHR